MNLAIVMAFPIVAMEQEHFLFLHDVLQNHH